MEIAFRQLNPSYYLPQNQFHIGRTTTFLPALVPSKFYCIPSIQKHPHDSPIAVISLSLMPVFTTNSDRADVGEPFALSPYSEQARSSQWRSIAPSLRWRLEPMAIPRMPATPVPQSSPHLSQSLWHWYHSHGITRQCLCTITHCRIGLLHRKPATARNTSAAKECPRFCAVVVVVARCGIG